MFIKFKKIFFSSMCLILSTSFYMQAINPIKILDIRRNNFCWASGNTNNIRVIKYKNSKKYFKECKIKLPINLEVKRIIKLYFCEYLNKIGSNDENLILYCLSDKQNMDKFINMGRPFQPNSNIAKYINKEISSDSLGIPSDIAESIQIDLKDFFLFASRELNHRNISSNLDEGMLQTNLAMKQLGTYRLAKYLKLEDIVAKTDFIKLFTDYGEKIGIVTDEAKGIDISEGDFSSFKISPNIQRELTTMQIFDTIVYERDHFNLENYKFKVNDNEFVGIISFDNESCFGSEVDLKKGLSFGRFAPTLTEDGKINLPYMDKSLAQRILNITDNDINNILKEILSSEQIYYLKTRIKSLQAAIMNTKRENEHFLISDDIWSKETMLDEINGNYGNTYFNHFCKNIPFSCLGF